MPRCGRGAKVTPASSPLGPTHFWGPKPSGFLICKHEILIIIPNTVYFGIPVLKCYSDPANVLRTSAIAPYLAFTITLQGRQHHSHAQNRKLRLREVKLPQNTQWGRGYKGHVIITK